MSTNQGLLAAFAAIGALAAVFVVVFAAVFAALAAYDAVSGSNMADDMGNTMKDMGGMMDDSRGDMMDGMMGGGGPETHPNAPGLYFIGFRPELGGNLRQIGIDAKSIARAIASAVDQKEVTQ